MLPKRHFCSGILCSVGQGAGPPPREFAVSNDIPPPVGNPSVGVPGGNRCFRRNHHSSPLIARWLDSTVGGGSERGVSATALLLLLLLGDPPPWARLDSGDLPRLQLTPHRVGGLRPSPAPRRAGRGHNSCAVLPAGIVYGAPRRCYDGEHPWQPQPRGIASPVTVVCCWLSGLPVRTPDSRPSG